MTTQVATLETRDKVGWTGAVIDADVHASLTSLDQVKPYLAPHWVEFIEDRGFHRPMGIDVTYPPNAPTTVRNEWRPDDGRIAASDLSLLQSQALDPWGSEKAVLTCYHGVDSIRHPDFAAALAAAINDWVIEEWLSADPRLVASMTVPARDPVGAAREIDRIGDHPQIVQVLMGVRSDRLYGRRDWYPLMEALIRHDLVFGLHYGGTADGPPSPTGWPSWFLEETVAEVQVYAAQLTSLLAEGAFQKFPDLRVAVLEGGFTWLSPLLWRIDKDLKGLRRDVPWVTESASELVRRHMRFSTAPLDRMPVDELARCLEWLGTDDLLMFATDYPHGYAGSVATLLEAAPDSMRTNLMSETARAFYRLG